MKGASRSLRENAERSVWGHMYDAWMVIMCPAYWPWRETWEAVCTVGNFMLFILAALAFPVMVPIAGISRKLHAKKRLAQFYNPR